MCGWQRMLRMSEQTPTASGDAQLHRPPAGSKYHPFPCWEVRPTPKHNRKDLFGREDGEKTYNNKKNKKQKPKTKNTATEAGGGGRLQSAEAMQFCSVRALSQGRSTWIWGGVEAQGWGGFSEGRPRLVSRCLQPLWSSSSFLPAVLAKRRRGAVRGAENQQPASQPAQPAPPPSPSPPPALPRRRLAEGSESNMLNDEENETWVTPPPLPPKPLTIPQPTSNEACIHQFRL